MCLLSLEGLGVVADAVFIYDLFVVLCTDFRKWKNSYHSFFLNLTAVFPPNLLCIFLDFHSGDYDYKRAEVRVAQIYES